MPELIEQRLEAIATAHGCEIYYACESGSRAWGFPSADSDYDVRFLYGHPIEWYLRLQQQKDTIEVALQQQLDIGGWELRKALRLFAGCNLALNEWLDSPVRYLESGLLRPALRELIPQFFNQRKASHHYLSLAQQAWNSNDGTHIKLKKLCYTLRATLAACWIERQSSMPPTLLPTMLEAELISRQLIDQVRELILFKHTSTEDCLIELTPELRQWIEQRLSAIAESASTLPVLKHPDWSVLNGLFRELIGA